MLKVGDIAPDFTLKAHDNTTFVTLSEEKGKRILLSFYPAAFTGVCTNQACGLSDYHQQLASLGGEIYGISVDAPFSNKAFAEANNIQYHLLSDVNREAIKAFHIEYDNFAIEGYTVAQRSIFIIESDGTIGYTWYAENPGVSPDIDDVMAFLQG
ncbi:MAG TPA: peroxiredoxin [Candidatus Poseidoniales archaeon]|nr:MAG TPA: peroxiredoxin [Candidatus Poseidoniales archaeon]